MVALDKKHYKSTGLQSDNKEKNNHDLCSKQSLIQSSIQTKVHTDDRFKDYTKMWDYQNAR